MFKRVSVVTAFTGLNLAATLLNQVVLAYLFGSGASMDAFLMSGALPFAVLTLAIGDLGYVLIPLLMEHERKGEARAAIDSSFTAVVAIAACVAVLGAIGHRGILRLTTAPATPAPTFELAASIAPLMWVIVGLTIIGSYLTGIHHYRRRFTLPTATLAVPYLGMIAGGLLGARHFGILSVVVGWAGGTFLRSLVLYVALPRPYARFVAPLSHPAAIALLRTLFPLGVSLLPFAALPMIDVFWASSLPVGSISYLGYSNRIVIALTSIVVQGVSIVLFPDLAKDIADGHIESFRRKVVGAVKMIFLAIVPLAVFAALMRIQLLQILLERGKFTSASSLGVARVLPLYLAGTIWMAMMNIIIRGFYATRDYITPAKIGVVALLIYTAMCGLLVYLLSYLGNGVAYSVFWLLMFIVQCHYLEKKAGALLTGELFVYFGKVLASSLLAAGVTAALSSIVKIGSEGMMDLTLRGTVCAALFMAISHYLFRLPQYRMVLAGFHRK